MRLTREQRAEFFAGRYPRLTYPGAKPCPVEKGERYRLSSLRELVVTGVRRSRKGEWVVVYEIHEQEAPLFLAARSPKAATQRDRDHFTEEQAKGYTHSRSQALDPAEAVHFDEIARLRASRESRDRYQAEKLDDVERLLGAMAELRAAINSLPREAKRNSGRAFWILRSRLDAAERDLRRRLAA